MRKLIGRALVWFIDAIRPPAEPVPGFRIDRVALAPGDTILFRSSERMTNDAAVRVRALLEARFPEHKVVVIDRGCELGVLHSTVDRGNPS